MAKYLNLKPIAFDDLSAKRKAAVQWAGRILLPKYDGCLALVFFRDGEAAGVLSRDGNVTKSMDHIHEDLLLKYPGLATDRGDVCVIGEAWLPGREFKELSGIFRRQSPQTELGFAPFDIVSVVWKEDGSPLLHSDTPYRERLDFLVHDRTGFPCLVFPPRPHECSSEAQANLYASNLKALGGYDGAIASDPDAPYSVSDGYGEFLKLKPLQTFSLRVLRLEVGVGDKTGKATGALVVRFKDGECGVGTGFDADTLAGWISNPAGVEGQIIEVACMGVYPGPKGMMREPRFVGIRHDVINADY